MKNNKNIIGLFTKWDVVLIIVILVVSFAFLITTYKSGLYYQNSVSVQLGDKDYSYKLDRNKKISLKNNGYKATIDIEKNRVRVIESDCPDALCQKKGWITNPGNFIACTPMKLFIEINGIEKGELDALNK